MLLTKWVSSTKASSNGWMNYSMIGCNCRYVGNLFEYAITSYSTCFHNNIWMHTKKRMEKYFKAVHIGEADKLHHHLHVQPEIDWATTNVFNSFNSSPETIWFRSNSIWLIQNSPCIPWNTEKSRILSCTNIDPKSRTKKRCKRDSKNGKRTVFPRTKKTLVRKLQA